MKTTTILACLAIVGYTYASTGTGAGFCYDDAEGCGPQHGWGEVCASGNRQSPIDFPLLSFKNGSITMDKSAYKAQSFRMQNNGHSIAIDIPELANKIFSFSAAKNPAEILKCKFAGAHFHWGKKDWDHGSEHTYAGRAGACELHLVHYQSQYNSLADALASGNPDALVVVGVVGLVQYMKDVVAMLRIPVLEDIASLIDTMPQVADADHDKWVTVSKPLDFTRWLKEAFNFGILGGGSAFTYEGSLTTPGCNPQVNWIVGSRPALVSHKLLEAFRSIPKDSEGKVLSHNYRPTQPLNGRQVHLRSVK